MPFDPNALEIEGGQQQPQRSFDPGGDIQAVNPNTVQTQQSGPQPTFQDAPGVGVVDVTSPTNPIVSGFGKPFAGLAGGAGQLYGDVTGRTPQWAQRASQYALSPNQSWVGTGTEALGWLPIGAAASRLGPFTAPVLGGLYATPSGSALSHGVGAAVGVLGDQVLRLPFLRNWAFGRQAAEQNARRVNQREFIDRLDEWGRHNDELDAYNATKAASATAPQRATKEWIDDAFKGIKAPIPKDIDGDAIDRLADWSGREVGRLNSKMDWMPTSDTISNMINGGNIVAASISPEMRGRWQQMFASSVLGGVTTNAASGTIPTRITGERFAGYVQRLRGMADEAWRQAANDRTNFRDWRKMARGLRQFADFAEDEAEGPDKPLRDKMRRARAMMGTLGRTADPATGDVATPSGLLRQRGRELGGREALRRQRRNSQILQRMTQLQREHAARPAEPQQPPVPRPYRTPADRADPITAAAGAHAAHHLTGIPAWLLYHGMRDELGRNRFANMAAAAARAGNRLPSALAGPLGAYSGQYLDQGPTGGVTP